MTLDPEGLRRHRERMQSHRKKCRKEELCIRCRQPVALDRKGEPMALCPDHLKQDRERKPSKKRGTR